MKLVKSCLEDHEKGIKNIKSYGLKKVIINGKTVSVIVIPLKDLNEGLADAQREIKNYQNPKDIDTAQGYGYREGTIDTLNWIKNYKM